MSVKEAAEAEGISARHMMRRIAAEVYESREVPSVARRGKKCTEVKVESLLIRGQRELRQCRQPAAHVKFEIGNTNPMRMLAVGSSSTEPQMSLDFERRDAFQLLPPAQQEWAMKWFQILVEAGVLWNGNWKKKFLGCEMRVGERVFYIHEKDDVMRYVGALHNVSVAYVYRRRIELLSYFAYLDRCRKQGEPPDLMIATKIFPSHSKHGGSFRRRPDAGESKTIPKTAGEWLIARYGRGSRPEHGDNDGFHPTMAQTHYDYELFREFLTASGHDAEAMGYPEISIFALRRLLTRPEIRSDPALLLAREGSKHFQDRVAPHIVRSTAGLFAHDWWVSDHTLADVWVRWSRDPKVVYRPWLTFWIDVRTRYPLSFVIAPVPSSITIMQSFLIALQTFRVKPRVTYCDNGKDYRAVALNGGSVFPVEANDGFDERQSGLFKRLGISPRNALPSRSNKKTGEKDCHARSKPIEGWFGGWLKKFDLGCAGACGNAPDAKPDKLTAELADPERHLMTDIEYEERLAGYLQDRYITKHKVREMGMSPAEALTHYSRAKWGLPVQTITAEEIGYYALAPAETRRVRNSMISIRLGGKPQHYTHERLRALNGQDVEVKFNPANPDEVYLYFRGEVLGLAHRIKELLWGARAEAIGEQMATQRGMVKAARTELVKRLDVPVPTQRQYGAIRALLAAKTDPAPMAHGTQIEHMKEKARGRRKDVVDAPVRYANDAVADLLATED